MLVPLSEPRRRSARFHVYDLEWLPGKMCLRLVGVKDRTRGYRAYSSDSDADTVAAYDAGRLDAESVRRVNAEIVHKFMAKELTERTSGDWFYAHAGGLADVQFLLAEIARDPRYSVDAAFSGSSAVIVTIKRGRHTWKMVDSYWTFRSPLAVIGEKLGESYRKGEVAWNAPLTELVQYNERDCAILLEALSRFEDVLLDLGSELRMTLASCSMRLFRRKYLKREIATNNLLNNVLRDAYVGGRVEVFYKKPIEDWERGVITPGWYYDVNSCYPFAMTHPLPGNFLRSMRTIPDSAKYCYFADVTVEVPEDCSIPPLPYVYDRSLYFPVGKFRGWYYGAELERALEVGAVVHQVHRVLVYEQFTDLRDFAMDLYERRMAAKRAGEDYLDESYKRLLNSGYGKFGERGDKVQLMMHPSLERLQGAKRAHVLSRVDRERRRPLREPRRYATDPPSRRAVLARRGSDLHMVSPGIFLIERSVPTHTTHVAVAAAVTAIGRVTLHRHMWSAKQLPYYCDTDGYMTTDPNVPTGAALGELKREKIVEDSMFFAPKLYCLIDAAGGSTVRAKGFGGLCACLKPLGMIDTWRRPDGTVETGDDSRKRFTEGGQDYACPDCGKSRKSKGLNREAFEKLIAGQAAVTNRMLRLRQLYGRGIVDPTEALDTRTVAGSRPKRCFNSDGTSRPWDVRELHEGKHLEAYEVQAELKKNRWAGRRTRPGGKR
jgi:hypothetical protein